MPIHKLIYPLYFSFIVPRGDDDGVCYASIMKTFLDALANDQLDLHPDVPLFRQGKSNAKGLGPYRPSCFTNQPVGKNNFLNVGKEVAQFLKLPDHLEMAEIWLNLPLLYRVSNAIKLL